MDKRELRKELRKLRDLLTQEERREKSITISERVIALKEFREASVVLLYAAVRSEVETQLIYNVAKKQGKRIYYPRVDGKRMEFYLVDEKTEFETGTFGAREPKAEDAKRFVSNVNDKICVVIPGIVFDAAGNRIGYGGGYYDKYLQDMSKSSVCKVALAYKCQMVDSVKKEDHDIVMDYIVTEEGCYKMNSYKYFENRECQYYPCHKMERINCLFCYCPLNHLENCPGNPSYIEVNGKLIKDCSECTFPHEADNYEVIMNFLSK